MIIKFLSIQIKILVFNEGKNLKRNSIFYKAYTPFVACFLIMLVMHLDFIFSGDDSFFMNITNLMHTNDFLVQRYHQWTSRIIVEYILVSLVHLPIFVWQLLDSIMCTILCMVISYLFFDDAAQKDKVKINLWIVFLFFLYPFSFLGSAGWIATTLNYLWPTVLGLVACIPIKKIFCEKSFHWLEYIVYIAALLFACNVEQISMIICAVYTLALIFFLLKHKKNYFFIGQLLLSYASLAFILLCEGNRSRYAIEVAEKYPNYEMLSIADKVNLGLTTKMGHFLSEINVLMVILTGMIALLVLKKYKDDIFYRFIGCIPFVMSFFCKTMITMGIPLAVNEDISMNIFKMDLISHYIPIVASVLFIACLCISLYLVFENSIKTICYIGIFFMGFGSRFLMGFSPTIFASGERTFFMFYVAIIILCSCMYPYLKKKFENVGDL